VFMTAVRWFIGSAVRSSELFNFRLTWKRFVPERGTMKSDLALVSGN